MSDEFAHTLVDSNILIDILTRDPTWFTWSAGALATAAAAGDVGINPIVYSEIAVRMEQAEMIDEAFPVEDLVRWPLPWEAAFLAGRAFLAYRRAGGVRRSPLPDFYIGAHASVGGLRLLTRDTKRYRTYFPKLQLISP